MVNERNRDNNQHSRTDTNQRKEIFSVDRGKEISERRNDEFQIPLGNFKPGATEPQTIAPNNIETDLNNTVESPEHLVAEGQSSGQDEWDVVEASNKERQTNEADKVAIIPVEENDQPSTNNLEKDPISSVVPEHQVQETDYDQKSEEIPSKRAKSLKPVWKMLEPENPEEDPVEHEICDFRKLEKDNGRWNVLAASIRGKSHAHTAAWRDDAYAFSEVDDWTVVAVSDGAGSAKIPELVRESSVTKRCSR